VAERPPALEVVIVGEDAFARAGIVAALERGEDLRVRDGGEPMRDDVAFLEPGVDVIVLDAGGAADGEDLGWAAGVPLVVLVGAPAVARVLLRAGAAGVVHRDGEPERLAAAVRAAAAGLRVIDPGLDLWDPGPWPAGAAVALTGREQEVLELMGDGLSNPEIAARLRVSAHTAKFHVTAILAKLGAESRTEAVMLALRAGMLHL
jgi:DNA-binding NarL/FixJ family response regulator